MALAIHAGVIRCARIPVAACTDVIFVCATTVWEATVDGAGISIIAGQTALAYAEGTHTRIIRRAGASIVATDTIGFKHTAYERFATVVGAWIPIIAVQWHAARSTGSVGTSISLGTGISIVTG